MVDRFRLWTVATLALVTAFGVFAGAKLMGVDAASSPAVLAMGALEPGVMETLAVLDAVVADGSFPFRKGGHCDYCAYDTACRRSHVPTLERLADLPRLADWRDVALKVIKHPLLADVRADRGDAS